VRTADAHDIGGHRPVRVRIHVVPQRGPIGGTAPVEDVVDHGGTQALAVPQVTVLHGFIYILPQAALLRTHTKAPLGPQVTAVGEMRFDEH